MDDGTAAADRPLAEILAERKKAKQDAFDDQWKQMKTGKHVCAEQQQHGQGKGIHVAACLCEQVQQAPSHSVATATPQPAVPEPVCAAALPFLAATCCCLPALAFFLQAGKNRPLDADELEFLETLAQREADEQQRVMSQEQAELEEYRQAVAAAAEAKAAAAAAAEVGGLDALAESSGRDGEAAAPGPGPGSSGRTAAAAASGAAAGGRKPPISSKAASKPLLPVLKPVVRVKPKGAAAGGEGSTAGADQRDSKRPKLVDGAKQQQTQQPASVGLEGLLGGYASDSE